MCTAIPMRLISRVGWNGVVKVDGVRCEVNLRLLSKVEIGDYVLVHAGCAIEKLDLQAAKETIESIREMIR